ncbi:hypothetical protein ABZP12_00001 [Xanthomonas euvesicatoria]
MSRPKRNNTPASIPEASETGIRRIARSNNPENPATIPNTAATPNAPTASPNGTPAALPISIAAPGVDQAVTTGTR